MQGSYHCHGGSQLCTRTRLPKSVVITHPKGRCIVLLDNIRKMVRTKLQHIRAVMDELKLPNFNLQDIKDDMTGADVMLANEDLFPVSQQQEWFRQNYRLSNAAKIRSQLENLGSDFASLANYCAAGGQRAPEIKAINLIETEKMT